MCESKENKDESKIGSKWLRTIVIFLALVSGLTALTLAVSTQPGPTLSLSKPLTVRWRYESNLTLNLTPAFDQERIYLPLAGGTIVSLRAADGQLYWKSDIGGELSSSPVADNGAVYLASGTSPSEAGPAATRRATGALRALGREGGVTLWMRTLAVPLRGSLTLSNEKIIGGANDGRIYAFDRRNGEILWSTQYNAGFDCTPVASGAHLYIGSEDGNLLAIDVTSGRILWRYRTHGPVRGPVAIAGSMLYFGSRDGYVYAVSPSNGHLQWRTRTGAGVQAVTGVKEGLLVASLDNFVYLFGYNKGTRIWKRQLPGRISAQPLTDEDNALFTPLSSDVGVVLALRDGKEVNSLSIGENMNTAASPILVGDAVFLTTEHGLIVFAQPNSAQRAAMR